jgi:hypothetical protein
MEGIDMADDNGTVTAAGASSVKVALNAKGEPSFEVKAYPDLNQEGLDDLARQALKTMAVLRSEFH